ncbi:hypothetical protein WOLCODRAFT_29407 [Wolfiporia cocos MD-104 SS10]|uniref:NAD(P)-binding protein n=1 Tax=Wolfiporia cocos (strain MD-104) TaxID=742152 RepID=A0A2H3JA60_WOLCO|nr:hypothetical protein WOLCODRAFT_29407 [Wolfiporia cocos MD-104 SS10]
MSVTWLVTGCSRGLGFELVKQLASESSNIVIATCRNPDRATALQDLRYGAIGMLHIVQLDVTDEESIYASVQIVEDIVKEKGIDYLYNNAGIDNEDNAFNIKSEDLLRILRTNVVAPALISQVYLPLVERSARKVIVNVSSSFGSIGVDKGPYLAAYSISKAALNMLTYKQAVAKPNITVIALDPGWTKTDMGGPSAALEPHESVAQQIQVVTSAAKDSGRFLNYSGRILPW